MKSPKAPSFTRRELLFASAASQLVGDEAVAQGPQNLTSLTPPDLFFVRDHFHAPEVSLATWRLKIEGRVSTPLELSLADLLEAPTNRIEAVLECAGNPAIGFAASNGIWEGVPFATLLRRAGVALDAAAVKLEGADSGRLEENLPELPYSQIVPLWKCIRPESMVAFKLNNQFLPPKNGFPARALFPGWYGMDSVKWLRKVVVLGPDDKVPEFALSGMNKLYNRMAQSASGDLKLTRVSEIQVRSVVSWPSPNVRLPVAKYFIRGFAWTGEGTIRSVAVSTDGGRKWASADLETKPKPFTWVQWRRLWSPLPGDYTVLSRAMDDSGREQPISRDPARQDSYELNFCAPVRCEVR